jgi:23S rRNA pseudouridine955/2504/2580 synthase
MNSIAVPSADKATLLVIGDEHAGQRIDNFLARHLKGVPKSHVYRILRSGEVRVNKGRVKPSYHLASHDRVRIPPVRTGEHAAAVPNALQARLEAAILLEDHDLIVLNKVAGLPVHGGSGRRYGVIEALRQARPHAPMLELAHRLDHDTSGCLLIAKSRPMLSALHELLRAGAVEKRYRALVAGAWRGGARKITAPLTRAAGRMLVREDGKPTVSLFKPVDRFERSTLVEVRIATGRMHQIRAHAAHLGHPIAGDQKYGDFAFNRRMRAYGLRRLFLHAAGLRFRAPVTGRYYKIQAPLDPHLQEVLAQLTKRRA